jgi:SAM-dependent methyltransferase
LAKYLADRGERVAVVTNDQGRSLVDTELLRPVASIVHEIGGGCFCCRYSELEEALVAAASAGASVTIAEAVGSCTDLVATVLAPLADRHHFQLAPLSILVDPWRVKEIEDGAFSPDVAYLFRKQLEEADVIVITRADANPPDVSRALRDIRPDAAVVAFSGRTGQGLAEWLAARPTRPAAPLIIDYDRYAAAEATLGWFNGCARISGDATFCPAAVVRDLLGILRPEAIAHLKVAVLEPATGTAAIVRRDEAPIVDLAQLPAETTEMRLLVNARIAMSPRALEERVRDALARAAVDTRIEWEETACFEPGRPTPEHRYGFRCGSGDDASCCAAFYDRPEVRYLLGDSLHPGGTALTLSLAAHLGLTTGSRLLDVACGGGASMRAIVAAWPVTAVGLDAAEASPRSANDRVSILRGDAHQIPLEDGSIDAVLCECALSTFADQRRALAEVRRVLRPGGRLVVSDMIVEGPIPDLLRPYAHAGACLAGARTERGWRELLDASGFALVEARDETSHLARLISDIKRKLVGAALAKAAGVLPDEVAIDLVRGRALIREAEKTLRDGHVRYGAWIGERRE